MTPFGNIATPSNDNLPSASRRTTLPASAPAKTPVVRSYCTPVVPSGFFNSKTCPELPASSPNTTVPHGVTCAGSHDDVPVRIVAVAPVAMSMRTRPGSDGPCSLQAMMCVGCVSSGQRAIMSMFGGASPAVTTRARRPFARVTSFSGRADAVFASTAEVDDTASGFSTPNSWFDRSCNSRSRNAPKSVRVAAATTPVLSTAVVAMAATAQRARDLDCKGASVEGLGAAPHVYGGQMSGW